MADEINCTGLTHQAFASYATCIAVPRGHRLARRELLRPGDLDGEAFITVSHEDTARRKFNAILGAIGVQLRIVMETPFSVSVMRLVKEGTGIRLVNPGAAGSPRRRAWCWFPSSRKFSFASCSSFHPIGRSPSWYARWFEN